MVGIAHIPSSQELALLALELLASDLQAKAGQGAGTGEARGRRGCIMPDATYRKSASPHEHTKQARLGRKVAC